MGHHWIPRRHLRRFQDPTEPGTVWQHDLRDRGTKRVPIKVAAQSPKFYTTYEEQWLADAVERPGGDAIDTLLAGKPLDDLNRMAITLYIATMIRRVPRHKERVQALVPDTLTGVRNQIKNDFDAIAASGEYPLDQLNARREAFDTVLTRYESSLPPALRRIIHCPVPSPNILLAVFSMFWFIAEAPSSQPFIASDNPAWFDEGWGIGRKHGSLWLPLSPVRVLYAIRSGETASADVPATPCSPFNARRLNRQLIEGASRFIYTSTPSPWVLEVGQKRRFRTEPSH